MTTASTLATAIPAGAAATPVQPEPVEPYEYLGVLERRAAKDMAPNPWWTLGAETMDRDYTIYRNWREYLGPLGVKMARIQSGWAKTEKQIGVYDWAWMDEIIRDMVAQGVEPWVCLCYGNPAYSPGNAGLGSNPPTDPKSLEGWVRYVTAFVQRYKDVVRGYEVWNEPRHGRAIAIPYAKFFVITAEAVRKVHPDARLAGFACFGIDSDLIDHGLEYLKQQGKIGLIDEVTYHPYMKNPDGMYERVQQLRDLVRVYSDKIIIRQAENGDSSTKESRGAMARMGECSEVIQAKWATRRMLGDLGRDIPSGYFTIADIHYTDRILRYGLLHSNDDQTIAYAKPAYRTVQNVVSTFDGSQKRIPGFAWYQSEIGYERSPYSVFGYQAKNGKSVVTVWRNDDQPRNGDVLHTVQLVLPNVAIETPVWADIRTGAVFAMPESAYERIGQRLIVKKFPVYDSVVVLADRSALNIVREPSPFAMTFGEAPKPLGAKDRKSETE